ncbi:hypothetical protein ACP4OV_003087 [Aristida adscensionis]
MATAGVLVFAGKSVAGAVIKEIITRAFHYLNGYFGAETMEEMKNKLDRALPKIQAVLDIATPNQVKGQSRALDEWFWQLRSAVERAEDAIDELEYYELEEKAHDHKVTDWGSPFDKMKHRAVKQVKNVGILDKTIKALTRRGTLKRLRKAVEDLDSAAATVMEFFTLTEHLKGYTSRLEEPDLNRGREAGSMLTATEVFGRQKEKELVIEWLTQTSGEDAEIAVGSDDISVVSVVGHGGMGKTTLAQLICQDVAVQRHFEVIMFACVSTIFDAETVIWKILESTRLEKPNANTLEALQRILKKELNSKRFLLVLDDVWDDKNTDQWKKLFAPLRTGKSGSKILLTTRMQSVADLAADAMTCQRKYLQLDGLKEDENIKLFNHIAFPGASFQDKNLRPISEQIAKNLRGCPLVTKVVASHLKGKQFQDWNNFLDQKLENFEGSSDDIMNILKLSYYHLPTELQTCFRYCSIFPQDYKFDKDKLVEMWMSSGLISQPAAGSQSLLDTAEQYLDELTKKSFFDHVEEGSGHYVMHDLMHDLAKFVSSGECARIVDVGSLGNVANTVRHICLEVEGIHNFPMEGIKKITSLKNLRTIVIEKGQAVNKDILNAMEELVETSKSLRVFQTKLLHTSNFLGKLGMLKHLRFIGLQQISPEGICGVAKLYHLTTLKCKYVKIKPKQLKHIGSLESLRNVEYGSYGWGNFPVGRLNSLLVLEDYCIQGVKGYTISSLKDLGNLRKLGVKGLENIGNQEEAKEANFKRKQYMKSLSLQWTERSDSNDAQRCMADELILDNLEPHANLRKLYISGFNGTRTPHWIAKPIVKDLVRLEFERCGNLEQLPVLEILTLKHLMLKSLPRLKKIGQSMNVSGDDCIELFLPPSLLTLEIRHCSKLGELPLLPPRLVSLQIQYVGLTKLPRIGKLQSGDAENVSAQLQDVYVKDCQNLSSLEGSLFEQRQYMAALRWLRIVRCVQLESAPLPFGKIPALQYANIAGCPKLRTPIGAETKLLPPSIKHLKMGRFGALELPLLRSLQGLSNLYSLELRNCVVESLPSSDVFKSLKSLWSVKVIGCLNLLSLGGLGSLRYLWRLKIDNCCKLAEVGMALPWDVSGGEEENLVVPKSSLVVDMLIIDPPLLHVEPLNSLCHTSSLVIWKGSEMKSLPEAWLLQNRSSLHDVTIRRPKSLESLPPSMRNLSSLNSFSLDGAEQLRSLPDLPSSLKWLSIRECSLELEKKTREYGSPERKKISHIREVNIGGSYFIMGKKCSYEISSKLSRQTKTHFLPGLANQKIMGGASYAV